MPSIQTVSMRVAKTIGPHDPMLIGLVERVLCRKTSLRGAASWQLKETRGR